MTEGYVIAAGVPLALLIFCCCFGYLCAKKRDKDHPTNDSGDARSVTAGPAAPIGPVSASHSSANVFDAKAAQPSSTTFSSIVGPSGQKNEGKPILFALEIGQTLSPRHLYSPSVWYSLQHFVVNQVGDRLKETPFMELSSVVRIFVCLFVEILL